LGHTNTHGHAAFRVKDRGEAFCLKAERVQTLPGQSERVLLAGDEMGDSKTNRALN